MHKKEIRNLNFKAPVNYLCVGASTGLESVLVACVSPGNSRE